MLLMTAAPIEPPMVRDVGVHAARDARLLGRNGHHDEGRHRREGQTETDAFDNHREKNLPLSGVSEGEERERDDPDQ